MNNHIVTVSQVNAYIKAGMDADAFLGSLLVTGEISNYKVYPSGHHYFSIKDAESSLRCVMFRSSAQRIRFTPTNGMKVIVGGRITVFPRDGAYQMYAERLIPDGAGDLSVAFEQLKEKLRLEGLFSTEHKKSLPRYPERIAVITSSAGAAVRDIIRVLRHRYPISKVIVLPVRVQGEEAPAEIAGAIRYANRYQVADLIITGRGGGSMEDLWAFNDERVARAIFDSDIPVISAVGHEPDETISDYVADLRAATPSNAAELAVPDREELQNMLDSYAKHMNRAMLMKCQNARRQIQDLSSRRVLQSPQNYLSDKRITLDYLSDSLLGAYQRKLETKKQRLISLTAKLDAMSPLKVMSRGYAIARRENGTLLHSIEDVADGDKLSLAIEDGILSCQVTERKQYGC